MAIRMPPGPAQGVNVVQSAVNDLMGDHVAALAAAGAGAPQVSQPVQRFFVKLNELTDVNFLANAKPIGWRYLVVGTGPAAVADVKEVGSGGHGFDSLIRGEFAQRLADAAALAEQQYGNRPEEFEARILEIPAIYVSAFWLHGPRDIFIPLVEGDAGKLLLPSEDPGFILRCVQAAAAKRSAAENEEVMPQPDERSDLQRAVDELVKVALQLNQNLHRLAQTPAAGYSAGAGAGGASAAATAIQLTADQRLICERMINAFETGSIQGDYSNITIMHDGPNDIRQITYGRAQTTEYGNLRELVDMYANAGGTFSADLRPFVERIGRVALVDDAQFISLLRKAGAQDRVMRDTQDVFFDRRYFQHALAWAQTNGFTRALSVLVIYDSQIHSGGILDFLRARFPEAIPARGGDEQTWIRQYVEVRDAWLRSHHRPEVRASAYRTRDLLREIGRGNWDLAMLPISANGVQVDARPLGGSLSAAGDLPPGVPYIDQTAAFGAGPQAGVFTVRSGHRYRATLSLSGFEQFAGNDTVASKLQGYGFTHVVVTGSGSTRIAEGTWGGPDTTGQLDSHIVNVVEIPAAPGGNFAGAGASALSFATPPQPGAFTVRSGHRYRATLSLGGFEQLAGNDTVASRLQGFGFTHVVVTGSGSTRIAEGTWSGPDTTAQLDSHIVSVVDIPAGSGHFV